MNVRSAVASRSTLWRDMVRVTWGVAARSPMAAGLLVLVLVVGNSTIGVMALATGGFVNAAIRRGEAAGAHGMAFWLGLYIAATLVEQFYWNFKNLAVGYMRDDTVHRLQGQVLRRAATVPLRRFEEREFFDGLGRVSADLHGRLNDLLYLVTDMGQLVIATAAGAAVLGAIQPGLLIVLGASTIPGLWLDTRVSGVLLQLQREEVTRDRMRAQLQGLLTGREAAAEVRLFRSAEYLLGRWRDLRARRTRANLRAEARTTRARTTGGALQALGYAASLAWVAWDILHGRLSVGSYVTVTVAALAFAERIGPMVSAFATFDEHARFLGDLMEFLRWAHPEEPAPPSSTGASARAVPAVGCAAVVAAGVTFTYPTGSTAAITGVSLRIDPGTRVAVVGTNGAGKSTLAKLLMGLYDPDSGTVRIDGRPPAESRGRIAAVFQDYAEYQLTLREAVGLGDPARLADDRAIGRALEEAGLGELPARLTTGLDGFVGREFGDTDLSGGQWQRLALARAYLRDADLVVLDEPTAALDPLAELAVFERFADLSRGRTAIMISHRLGVARLADRVLVLDAGRLVEDGTHAGLLSRGGVYAGLFSAQAQWYRAEAEE